MYLCAILKNPDTWVVNGLPAFRFFVLGSFLSFFVYSDFKWLVTNIQTKITKKINDVILWLRAQTGY